MPDYLPAGIHAGITEERYHADPCPEPSLSSSIAKVLTRRSPMHAWHAHPRLNPDHEPRDGSAAMDAGSIIHQILLGAGAAIEPILVRHGPKSDKAGELVTDWRSKMAQDLRDDARAAGKIPVLPHVLPGLHLAANAARAHLESHPEGKMLFEPGRPEVTLVWQEGAIWCRGRIDFLLDDPALPPLDVKTTELSAAPESWERRVQMEYAFQAAFYQRGLRALGRPSRHTMRFLVIEQQAPYGVSVLAPAPSLMILAEEEVDRAIRVWTHCIQTNQWPGYPPFTAHVEAKPWQVVDAEMRALNDTIMQEQV